MAREYNIDIRRMKIYYTDNITKKIVNRIRNFIKYRDLNCLMGMMPIKVNEVPADDMVFIQKVKELKDLITYK